MAEEDFRPISGGRYRGSRFPGVVGGSVDPQTGNLVMPSYAPKARGGGGAPSEVDDEPVSQPSRLSMVTNRVPSFAGFNDGGSDGPGGGGGAGGASGDTSGGTASSVGTPGSGMSEADDLGDLADAASGKGGLSGVTTALGVQDIGPLGALGTAIGYGLGGPLGGKAGSTLGSVADKAMGLESIASSLGIGSPDAAAVEAVDAIGMESFGPPGVSIGGGGGGGNEAASTGGGSESMGSVSASEADAIGAESFGPSAAGPGDTVSGAVGEDSMAGGSGSDTAGGGGGGGSKIICLELHRQGLLDPNIFEADERWGDTLSPLTLAGYHLWAEPIVARMREDRAYARKVARFARPIARAAASRMGVGKARSYERAALRVGTAACWLIGAIMHHTAQEAPDASR